MRQRGHPYGKPPPLASPPVRREAEKDGDMVEAALKKAVAAPVVGEAAAGSTGAAAVGPAAAHAAAAAREQSMAELLGIMNVAAAGAGRDGPGGGTGGGAASASVQSQLKLHRQMLLQLDTRMRRREALMPVVLGPGDFPPALAGVAALDGYLAKARAAPRTHNMGGTDTAVGVAALASLATMSVEGQDNGIQARMAVMYLLADHALTVSSARNAMWIQTFSCAVLPATAHARERTLMSWDIIGETLLPTPDELALIIDAVKLAETQTVDLSPHTNALFVIVDGVPSVPHGKAGRAHPISRTLLALLSALGATKTQGAGPRGTLARKLLEMNGGKGRGRGRGGGRGSGAAGSVMNVEDEDGADGF